MQRTKKKPYTFSVNVLEIEGGLGSNVKVKACKGEGQQAQGPSWPSHIPGKIRGYIQQLNIDGLDSNGNHGVLLVGRKGWAVVFGPPTKRVQDEEDH